ncbi:MAG: hypothetical protein IPI43_11710 [Sandaracinaceae bacterium]|nr:hypothetical protein [Sandaracinaceae bacterium]
MSADSSRAPLVFGVVFFSLIATVIAHVIGGSNPYTPAGSEGYVFHQPLVIGQREFIEVQRGPTSTGWRWAQQVINLDMRVATYTEQMQIFSLDNLEVTFEVHARIRLRPGTAREVIERYSGADWFATNVRRPYVTATRVGAHARRVRHQGRERGHRRGHPRPLARGVRRQALRVHVAVHRQHRVPVLGDRARGGQPGR